MCVCLRAAFCVSLILSLMCKFPYVGIRACVVRVCMCMIVYVCVGVFVWCTSFCVYVCEYVYVCM